MGKISEFFNRKVGGLMLGLIILGSYVSLKWLNLRLVHCPELWLDLSWYGLWFTGIIINALVADLFVNSKEWVYNTMENVMRPGLSSKERIVLIRNQLDVAVNKYHSIFIQVNGFETKWAKIKAMFRRVTHGAITVKELIVIVAYALWDLVIREGATNLDTPYDILILFLGLLGLKIVDAKSGFANLVMDMYEEALQEKEPDNQLVILTNYIKQLCNLYDIEYTNMYSNIQADKETAIQYCMDTLTKYVPAKAETLNEIKEKLLKITK